MSTYTPVASQTISASASSVTFNNLPQDYTDLVLVVAGTYTSGGTNDAALQFNSDTGSNYSWTRLLGNGSAASSSRSTNDVQIDFGLISSTNQSNSIAHIQNYSNSTTYKTVLGRGNSTEYVGAIVGTWRNTSAITSITVKSAATYSSGCTFSLYGIQAGTPKAQGGQIVTTDGTYWYHAFTASGTFTPSTAITADYLVVAGGGGGSGYSGGGGAGGAGGAGGLRSTVTATGGGGSLESALSLSANTSYSVIIGAGGSGGLGNTTAQGANGNDSIFSSITSTGGGAGGNTGVGSNGGSGGGGGAGSSGTWSGGTRTVNQGYNGGSGTSTGSTGGGGGGGAGAVGSNGSSGVGGNGGAGVAISALATATNTGVSSYYAGGGGGGTIPGTSGSGGSGGGGAGGNANAGTTNTGGGGGGGSFISSSAKNGGAGGSGIVIIRYAV